MSFAPTAEQQAIRDIFATGESLVIEALAGTGKTTTLKMLAQDAPRTAMTYVAFNRAIADEARRTFPRNVTCSTMHSFAYRALGAKFSGRLNGPRVAAWQIVNILGIPSRFDFGKFNLRDRQVARLVTEAVNRFCHSAAEVPTINHIPRVPGMDTPEAHDALSQFLFPFVEKAWEDLQRVDGQLRFSHDVYLKLWSMGNPQLPGDVVLFDEAQDGDPVIMHIVRQQMERGARILPVGDAQQQIYEWRGAVNALGSFDAQHRLPLQKSFRFGPAIAERANLLLEVLGTDLRLEGHEPVGSQLASLDAPDAILCRTNAQAVGELMLAQVAGIKAGLVGGTSAVESLAKAAQDLMEGRKTWHQDLMAFDNWAQVQAYVDESGKDEAKDIAVLVKLVDKFGPETILEAVGRAVPEEQADLVISTAHKAKGREWDRVRVATDFRDPVDEQTDEWLPGELRLQYVTVTRAKQYLDDLALPWVDDLAIGAGLEVVRLDSAEVPVREVIEMPVATGPVETAQVICDPESADRLVMCRTKYDPELVSAQQRLAGRQFRGEYCGLAKVNIVRATHSALAVAERFRLTVSPEARARVEELGLA